MEVCVLLVQIVVSLLQRVALVLLVRNEFRYFLLERVQLSRLTILQFIDLALKIFF